jgi:hypothetical protein
MLPGLFAVCGRLKLVAVKRCGQSAEKAASDCSETASDLLSG